MFAGEQFRAAGKAGGVNHFGRLIDQFAGEVDRLADDCPGFEGRLQCCRCLTRFDEQIDIVERVPLLFGPVQILPHATDRQGGRGNLHAPGEQEFPGSAAGTATAIRSVFFAETFRAAVVSALCRLASLIFSTGPRPISRSRFARIPAGARIVIDSASFPVRSWDSRSRVICPESAASSAPSGPVNSNASGTPTISQSPAASVHGVVASCSFMEMPFRVGNRASGLIQTERMRIRKESVRRACLGEPPDSFWRDHCPDRWRGLQ